MKLDNAHRLIAAAHRPGWFTLVGRYPHHFVHQGRILAVRVGGTILKAEQIHRRLFAFAARGVVRDKSFPLPAYTQQIRGVFNEIAQRVNHRILSVGADLDQQIAMTQGRIQGVIREAHHLLQRFGFLRGETKAIVKQRGPQRYRHGQVIRGNIGTQDPRVHRRQTRVLRIGRRAAGGQKCNALRQKSEQTFQLAFIAGQYIKGHQHH